MDARRRRLLAAVPSMLLGGCFGSDDLAEVEPCNWHGESHELAVRVTGTESEEPLIGATRRLQPEEELILDEKLDLAAVDGEIAVFARIDDGDEQRRDVGGGFASLSVSIDDSGSISVGQSVHWRPRVPPRFGSAPTPAVGGAQPADAENCLIVCYRLRIPVAIGTSCAVSANAPHACNAPVVSWDRSQNLQTP